MDFGLFAILKDCNSFNRVRVSFDTIEWDLRTDLDPEFVCNKSQCSVAQ
nr:hypothetical protein [Methylomarinum sp. Ch1-1]MDP4519848.1 hypothetical protein [Methylomarinum sp. Ch1-1]